MNIAQSGWHAALVLGVTLVAAAPDAASQNRAKVGDLVEFTSGFGPTLAEIVEGPDASGYVVILLPTGKQVPVNTQKLRLVQGAGTTPDASMAVGEPVGWVEGGVGQRGSVVKVNGGWCQVKTADATTNGWIECKTLRTSAQATAPAKPKPATSAAGKSAAVKLQGNWENADGTVKWEAQPGNKCFMSLGPMSGACTYKQTANGVAIMIDGDELALEANDDGSLSSVSEANSMMAIRLKRKK